MTWQAFVLAYGRSALAHHLAAVVGEPVTVIEGFRRTHPCARGTKRHFGDLFTLFHGRPPRDEEWPAPRRVGGGYEWLAPEIALLATLVGQHDARTIGEILTTRLQRLTGDSEAFRGRNHVTVRTNHIGLQLGEVTGGLTIRAAADLVGSHPVVFGAIQRGDLVTTRVGCRHVIPREAFEAWLAARDEAPAGWIRLARLMRPLGIKSDSKLPEYAKLGYIPQTLYIRSKHLWFIAPETARQIVADAHAGRPLPWHGKPLPGNLAVTWRKYRQRRHRWCRTCTRAWGDAGAPKTFQEFCRRYPTIDYGLKRHMTTRGKQRLVVPRKPCGFNRAFSGKGVTIADASRQLGKPRTWILMQIRAGVIRPLRHPTDRGAALRISPSAMARMRHSPVVETRGRKPGQWCGCEAASRHAGVSVGTMATWGFHGAVRRKRGPRGWLYQLTSIEDRSRRYWATCRFHRAVPPSWITGTPEAAA